MELRRIDRLPPYVFGVVNDLKMEARRRGQDIIDLGMGNPDLATPSLVVEKLQEAVLRAPTSRNLQPWRFVFVTDAEILRALGRAKPHYSDFLAGAALGVVVCADASVSDCWIEDGAIAAATLQLVATELGLGSCWIQIRARQSVDGRPSEEHIREVLGVEAELSVLCVISVGYPAEMKPPKDLESLSWDKVEVRPVA